MTTWRSPRLVPGGPEPQWLVDFGRPRPHDWDV
jgi:hypothetical protein